MINQNNNMFNWNIVNNNNNNNAGFVQNDDMPPLIDNDIINRTSNLIIQLYAIINGVTIRDWLMLELEYEIGISGNAAYVPVAWVEYIVPRLVAVRANYDHNDIMFVNNFRNETHDYNVDELTYILGRLQNMIIA